MLTGDHHESALNISKQVGLENFEADLKPEDKLARISELSEKEGLVMVGDGINDAPALSQADVGIALGAGTDVAIEAADITLIGNDLRKVIVAIRLSQATMRNIKQNLFWASIYNVVLIPAAAVGWLNPVLAAAAMGLSSVSVVGNALRLRLSKFAA